MNISCRKVVQFRLRNAVSVAALAACVAGTAGAADVYPAKPVKLVIPFPPGGSNDVVGRVIAQQLGERLGQQVVVDNRGGAGGVIGTEMVAKASPDGHTLLFISSAFAANSSLYKLPYDPVKAFVPVAMIAAGPNVLAVAPNLPVNSVKELIALAKQKPGQLNYASAGIGSFQHLGSALFVSMARVDIVHVPFKGGGPAMVDVIAGNTRSCSARWCRPCRRSSPASSRHSASVASSARPPCPRCRPSPRPVCPVTTRSTGGASSRRPARRRRSSRACTGNSERSCRRRTCKSASRPKRSRRSR